ncbi:MAG: peptidylprolyl isomerase [Longimicrobiales bacterium]
MSARTAPTSAWLPLLPGLAVAALASVPAGAQTVQSAAEVVAAATDDEWRGLDPDNTVYFELEGGRVVVELAPWAAPRHVEALRAIVRGGHYDGAPVVRSQDNYVAQWRVAPPAEGASLPGSPYDALAAEFTTTSGGLPFTPLPDPDVYAAEAGFVRGFPVGRAPGSGAAWIAHCYGTVAVPRGNDPDAASPAGLYAVTGHAPRHLDRNATVVGRVVQGMEHLTTLRRGTGTLGFYETPEERPLIRSARMGSDLDPADRAAVEVLRTDSESFRAYVLASRTRTEEWFVHPTGRIELCNVRIPVRPVP